MVSLQSANNTDGYPSQVEADCLVQPGEATLIMAGQELVVPTKIA